MTTMTTGSIAVATTVRRRPRRGLIHALAVRAGLALANWGRGGFADRDRARREFDRLVAAEARLRAAERYGLMHR